MELLTDIFYIGLQECDLDDHRGIKYLGAITSTCSAWRNAALGTPLLWRRIIYKDHCDDVPPESKDPAIPQHMKERLLEYLSRSKGCSILVHLEFGANSFQTQAVKRIVRPHLPRCLSISLRGKIDDFLPLPGELYRLTEFACAAGHPGGDESTRPSIFTDPERVTLRKLTLTETRLPLDNINVQDLEDVLLSSSCDTWPAGATFISRCHSLTTLIITDDKTFGEEQSFTPFTLPHLIYLDIVGLTIFTAARTPSLQTLILNNVYCDEFRGTVIQLPSLPGLTTLCVMCADANSVEIMSLLALNPGIKRLILSECDGIYDVIQSLKGDGTGGAANTDDTTLLPSLSLLQVCECSDLGLDEFRALFTHRPTLRIEYGATCGPCYMHVDTLKATIEEPSQDDEPDVFTLWNFRTRVVVRED